MKRPVLFVMLLSAVLSSCDEHVQYPDNSLCVGDIVMSDGSVLRPAAADSSRLTPVAVVFYVNHNEAVQGDGYAVYMSSVEALAFADSLGVKQGTSASATSHDGNENTYSMYVCSSVSSPAAERVFDMWICGQSAYVPSVAQLRLLYASLDIVNASIDRLGGQLLSVQTPSCWYWTSTEVAGQEDNKAWLYSLSSGAVQETPKTERHSLRPVITLNR